MAYIKKSIKRLSDNLLLFQHINVLLFLLKAL